MPGVEEALALDPRSGVRRIKRRLIIRSGEICPPFSSTSGKADVLYNVYRYLLGSEQMSDQIMRWRGCWAKPGAPIVIFSGAGWLVFNIATISCFGDTFHLFSSGTNLWLFLACLQILHSAEFALFGKP